MTMDIEQKLGKVAHETLQILKGNGLSVNAFDAKMKPTLEVSQARWFYEPNVGLMVHITEDQDKPEMKIYLSTRLDQNDALRQPYMSLRSLARQNNILPTVKVFDYKIEPKDFVSAVTESFSRPEGSTKSSYQSTGEAKLIIRHSKPVDESVTGSRSRNIKSLFIENNAGERFKYPHLHLLGARAMTKHVSEGGTPFDELGQQIIALSEERSDLLKLVKWSRGLNEERVGEMITTVGERLAEIKEALHKCVTRSGYKSMKESGLPVLQAGNPDELRELFTKKSYDEGLDRALGLVNSLSEQRQHRMNIEQALVQAEEAVAGAGEFKLTSSDDIDPNLYEYDDQLQETIDHINHLVSRIPADLAEMKSKLFHLGEIYPELADSQRQRVAELLNKVETQGTPKQNLELPLHLEAFVNISKHIKEMGANK